jgi:heptosyltransferase III
MTQPLVPTDLLKKSDKILFIAHLALGDFTYLQNCFQAFAQAHPHIKMHLWVDEVRRTRDATQWEHLKKYSLYDWVASCPFFDKVYTRTYSPALYDESIREARQHAYPIVVSLATLRPHRYASLARAIAPDGFVAGMKKPAGLLRLHHHLGYRKLSAAISPSGLSKQPGHISNVYADWFRQLFDLEIPLSERFPFVNIPDQWKSYAHDQLAAWDFDKRQRKLVFINPFAKTKKRCWPLERVAELIIAMKKQHAWRDACFIVNAVPQELANAKKVIDAYALERTRLFSAEENFFQLPALLSCCDLIISVETAVMHLANAVHIPVVALMRQKNPEWVPVDTNNSTVITALRRQDWVDAISVEQVMKCL